MRFNARNLKSAVALLLTITCSLTWTAPAWASPEHSRRTLRQGQLEAEEKKAGLEDALKGNRGVVFSRRAEAAAGLEGIGSLPTQHDILSDFTKQFLSGRVPAGEDAALLTLEGVAHPQLATEWIGVTAVAKGMVGKGKSLDSAPRKKVIDEVDLWAQSVQDRVARTWKRYLHHMNFETKGLTPGGLPSGAYSGDPAGAATPTISDVVEDTKKFTEGLPGSSSFQLEGPGAVTLGSFPDEARAMMVVTHINPELEAQILQKYGAASIEELLDPERPVDQIVHRVAELNAVPIHKLDVTILTGDASDLEALEELQGTYHDMQFEALSGGTFQPALAASMGVRDGRVRLFVRRSGMTEAVFNTDVAGLFSADGAIAVFRPVSEEIKSGNDKRYFWTEHVMEKMKALRPRDCEQIRDGKIIFSSRQVTQPIVGAYTFLTPGRTDRRLPFHVPGVGEIGGDNYEAYTLAFASNPRQPGAGYLWLSRNVYPYADAAAGLEQDPLKSIWAEAKETWNALKENPFKPLLLDQWAQVYPFLKANLERPDPAAVPEFLLWQVLLTPAWEEKMRKMPVAQWEWLVDLVLSRWEVSRQDRGPWLTELKMLVVLDRLLLSRRVLRPHLKIIRRWNEVADSGRTDEELAVALLDGLAAAGSLPKEERLAFWPEKELKHSLSWIAQAWRQRDRPSVWEGSHLRREHLPLLTALPPAQVQALFRGALGQLLFRSPRGYDSMGILNQAELLGELIVAMPHQLESTQEAFWAALADRPVPELLDPLLEMAGDLPPARTPILRFLVAVLNLKAWHFSDQDMPWINLLYLTNRIRAPEEHLLLQEIHHLLLERFSGAVGIARDSPLRPLTRPLEDPNSFGPDLNGFIRREAHHIGGSHVLDLAGLRLQWWYTGDKGPLAAYLSRLDTVEARATAEWLARQEEAPEAKELRPAIRQAMERLAQRLDRPLQELSVEVLATVDEEVLQAIRSEGAAEAVPGWDRLFDREIPAYRILWGLYGTRTLESAIAAVQEFSNRSQTETAFPREPFNHLVQGLRERNLSSALSGLADLESAIQERLLSESTYPKWDDKRQRAFYEAEFEEKREIHHGIPAVRAYRPDDPNFQLHLLLEKLRPIRRSVRDRLIEEVRHQPEWGVLAGLLSGVLRWAQAMEPRSQHLKDLSEVLASDGLTPARLRLVSLQLTRYLEGRMAQLDEGLGPLIDAVASALDEDSIRPQLLESLGLSGPDRGRGHWERRLRPHLERILFERQQAFSTASVFAEELWKRLNRLDEEALTQPIKPDSERPGKVPSGWFALSEEPNRLGGLTVLGEKARNLALLHQGGHPVPPAAGYPIGRDPRPVVASMEEGIRLVEAQVRERGLQPEMGARFGDSGEPLLLSVRSGALYTLPGQLATIGDVGIHAGNVEALARRIGAWAAWDAYRRFIQEFAMAVYGLDREIFDRIIEGYKREVGVVRKIQLTAEQMRAVAEAYLAAVKDWVPQGIPEDPREQLRLAIEAVVGSWNLPRVRDVRQAIGMGHEHGTAVILHAMVFGNFSQGDGVERSGAGVAVTSESSAGPVLLGSFGQGDQGFDIAEGVVLPRSLNDFQLLLPETARELRERAFDLRNRSGEERDIEFTVQNGRLWLLQDRMAQGRGAISRFSKESLPGHILLGKGEGLAGGAVRGVLAFPESVEDPEGLKWLQQLARQEGVEGILLVMDTAAPEDTPLLRKEGVMGFLARRGGRGQHEGIIANLLRLTAVAAVDNLERVDTQIVLKARKSHFAAPLKQSGEKILSQGEVVSIDGLTGEIYLGKIPLERTGFDLRSFTTGEVEKRATAGLEQETVTVGEAMERVRAARDIPRQPVHLYFGDEGPRDLDRMDDAVIEQQLTRMAINGQVDISEDYTPTLVPSLRFTQLAQAGLEGVRRFKDGKEFETATGSFSKIVDNAEIQGQLLEGFETLMVKMDSSVAAKLPLVSRIFKNSGTAVPREWLRAPTQRIILDPELSKAEGVLNVEVGETGERTKETDLAVVATEIVERAWEDWNRAFAQRKLTAVEIPENQFNDIQGRDRNQAALILAALRSRGGGLVSLINVRFGKVGKDDVLFIDIQA